MKKTAILQHQDGLDQDEIKKNLIPVLVLFQRTDVLN